MPTFHALVDAVPGREAEVGAALRLLPRVRDAVPCKEGSFDFLIRFDAASFDVVDDFLQTNVRRLPGVKGVEVIVRWEDHGPTVAAARERLG